MHDQRRLAGNARPRAVPIDPGIGESPAAEVSLSVPGSFLAIDPSHDCAVAINVRAHGFIHNLFRMERGRRHAGHELSLVHEGSIVVDVDQRWIKQAVEGGYVLIFLGLIPGIFQRKNLGFFGTWQVCLGGG